MFLSYVPVLFGYEINVFVLMLRKTNRNWVTGKSFQKKILTKNFLLLLTPKQKGQAKVT